MTTARFRFLPRYRLKKSDEFRRVFGARRSASDQWIIVYALENGLNFPRLGLSVSRKLGNAVTRNRWKRLLREAFRSSVVKLPSGFDLVIVPRQGVKPELAPLIESLKSLSHRAARRRKASS